MSWPNDWEGKQRKQTTGSDIFFATVIGIGASAGAYYGGRVIRQLFRSPALHAVKEFTQKAVISSEVKSGNFTPSKPSTPPQKSFHGTLNPFKTLPKFTDMETLSKHVDESIRTEEGGSKLFAIRKNIGQELIQNLLNEAKKKHFCDLTGAQFLAATCDNIACKKLIEQMPYYGGKKEIKNLWGIEQDTDPGQSSLTNLNSLAARGRIFRAYGREEEAQKVLSLVTSQKPENVILLSAPGVGKTALIHEIAFRLCEGSVQEHQRHIQLWELNLENLLGKSNTWAGLLQENLQSIIKTVKKNGNAIIFIDEFHKVGEAGTTKDNSSQTIGEQLKTELTSGSFTVIGASTHQEYDRYITQKNPALDRRFYKVNLNEPNESTTVGILQNAYADMLGNFASEVVLTYGALAATASLARTDMPYVRSPAREFRILNNLVQAARLVHKQLLKDASLFVKLKTKLELLSSQNYGLSILDQYEKADLQQEVAKLSEELEREAQTSSIDRELVEKWNNARLELQKLHSERQRIVSESKNALENNESEEELAKHAVKTFYMGQQIKYKELVVREYLRDVQREAGPLITTDMVAKNVAEVTGIPIRKPAAEERVWLQNLEKEMKNSVIGQDKAVEALIGAYIRFRQGMKDPKQTIGNFLFVGPTGLGKTYLASQFASRLMAKGAMHQFNMGEFATPYSFQKLLGSDSGYDNGLLAGALRKNPHSLILFDEFEKSPEIYRVLLEVLDRGTITNNDGTSLECGNSLFVMTSNLCSDLIQKFCAEHPEPLSHKDWNDLNKILVNELLNYFPPEFINRLDGVIPFIPISKKACCDISRGLLTEFAQQAYREKKLHLDVTSELVDYCVDKGFDSRFGARPLKRLIKNKVRTLIAKALNDGRIKEGDTIKLVPENGKLVLKQFPLNM